MGIPGNPSFDERRKTAAAAKAKLLEKFKSAPGADDPAVQARLAERKAIADEREKRRSDKERQRQAEKDKIAAEASAVLAAQPSSAAVAEQQKAERDRRYAARKARKG
jgi:uncharacterized protein involved in exopolysaccharide biosynthesis